MPLLDRLMRRLRAVREQEAEMDRREQRTRKVVAKAHQAADRGERLAREMKDMGRALR